MLLAALAAALGCGRPVGEPEAAARFVRDGIFISREASASSSLRVSADNVSVTLTQPRALAGGLLFDFSWKPAQEYSIEMCPADGSIFPGERVVAPSRPEPLAVAVVELEDVHAGSVTAGGEPDASLAFSADGTLLAVGTFGGYLRVFDTGSGRMLFEKRIPGAVVKRVALSSDNSRVYAGEMSYDGFVTSFDLRSKKELWRHRLADDLETSTPVRPDDFFALYSYPQAWCMRALGDDLLVDGSHSWNAGDAPRHLSRIYRFDGRTGRVVWRFPENAPLPRNISWFDVGGDILALSAYQRERPAAGDNIPQAAVCLLDAVSGELLDRHDFEPLKPFFDTVPMWYGLAFNDSGGLAVGTMDGRCAVFDTARRGSGRPKLVRLRMAEPGAPVEVTGVPICAGAGWAAGAGDTLFVLTDGRLIAPSAGARGESVRADHPASNTLFAFDGRGGTLLWRWKLSGAAQGVCAARSIVAVSTQQSYSADDPLDYGLILLDTSGDKPPVERLIFPYPTSGPIVALAVSPDARTIAAVETPVRLPDGLTVVGKHRLHMLH
jgi:WD40 repeat protein